MRSDQGFTLLEMSIALVVTGLLLTGGVSLMTGASDVNRYKATQAELTELKEVLQSYYAIYYRLPCPAPNRDGIAATSCDTPDSLRGYLPYSSLGLGGKGDPWGQPYKYIVSPVFTHALRNDKPYICEASFSDIRASTGKVRVRDLEGSDLVDYAAFVVLSTGKNGQQSNAGMTSAFANGGCSDALADLTSGIKYEQENCDADSDLYHGVLRADGSSVIFDDILTWVGDMQLIGVVKGTGVCDVLPPPAVVPTLPPVVTVQPENKTDYDFTSGAYVHSGNYRSGLGFFEASKKIPTSNADDKVVVTENLTRDLDLGNGKNSLLVNGYVDGLIGGGSDEDIVKIGGSLISSIDLKAGNDQLEIEGSVDLYSSRTDDPIDMGAGNDQIRIYGNVSDSLILLGSGENTIYVGGTISSGVRITAKDGTGILYYDSPTKPGSSALTLGSTVTIKCRINNAWTDCP